MDAAKVRLSPEEMDLVLNPGWILTKNTVLEKVKEMLGHVQLAYEKELLNNKSLPPGILETPPKISKGEYYKGLPWLVLDYPRCFNKEDIFTVRTMFWWGNFFSLTLQLSGGFKKMFEEHIIRSMSFFSRTGFFICVNEDQWEHDFEKSNYRLINSLPAEETKAMIRDKAFIKLAARIPLSEWDKVHNVLPALFSGVIKEISS